MSKTIDHDVILVISNLQVLGKDTKELCPKCNTPIVEVTSRFGKGMYICGNMHIFEEVKED